MGGDYLQGFTAGAFSSLVGSGAQVLGLGSSGILGSTTLAGGFGSYIAGGYFINGASIGISIGLHNHLGDKYRRIGRNTLEAIEPLEEVVCAPQMISGLDAVHSALDVIGMIPGGDFADFLNAGIYAIEGDYANAGISAAAMIPVVGNFATGGKLVKNAAKYSVYVGKNSEGVVKYVGITRRKPEIRFAEHARSKSPRAKLMYKSQKQYGLLNKMDARIKEQKLINEYGMDNLYNKINSISPIYWGLYGIK